MRLQEIDVTALVLGAHRDEPVGPHLHVAANVEVVPVRVPRRHPEPYHRRQLQSEHHRARPRLPRDRPRCRSRRHPRRLPAYHRRVLRRLEERSRRRGFRGPDPVVPVVDRDEDRVVGDGDLLVGVPDRDLEGEGERGRAVGGEAGDGE